MSSAASGKVLSANQSYRLGRIAAKANKGLLKKYFSRWRKYRNPATIGMRTLDPFPQRKYSRMVMVMNNLITAPASNLAYEYIYRVNSTFAPDLTGGSNRQPYARDTMATLYSYYQTYYAVAEVEFYDTTADGCVVGYQVQGDSINNLAIAQIDERPWAKCTSMSNSGEQKKKFIIKIPMHTALGVLKSQYKNDTNQYGAAYNANPTQGVFLRLFAVSTQAGASTDVKFRIKLTQHTIWNTRTSLSQS